MGQLQGEASRTGGGEWDGGGGWDRGSWVPGRGRWCARHSHTIFQVFMFMIILLHGYGQPTHDLFRQEIRTRQ